MTAVGPASGRRLRAPAVLAAVVAMVAGLAGPAGASNDAYFDRQWSLTQIRAPQAWATSTGSGVTIGIVDTGVDAGHPDLAGKIVATADCVGRPCGPGGGRDGNGHGTIVSGIAAAVTNNGVGIAGVAPDAALVVAKVLDDNGEGRAGDINNGIRWVVDQGARVVNLSLGDPNVSVANVLGSPLRTGIDYAWSRGAVPVLASGNYGTGSASGGGGDYANLNALVVGATNRAGAVASYSGSLASARWGLVAPGGGGAPGGPDNNVLSTYPVDLSATGYASSAGTSMAAPQVSGALALLLAQGLAPAAAVNRLLSTVDTSMPCGTGCRGRLDVAAAVGSGPGVAAPARAATATVTPGAGATVTPGNAVPVVPAPAPAGRRQAAAPSSTLPAAPPARTAPARSVLSGDAPQVAAPTLAVPLPVAARAAGRNLAVVAAAAGLALAMAGAVGGVGLRRLRVTGI